MRAAGVLLAILLCVGTGAAQEAAPIKAELPVLVTSAGQALDAFTLKTLLTRAGVKNEYKPQADVGELKDVKTLIVAFGASVKGFGAAGITADTEMARARRLLDAARQQKLTVIGVHIGGQERRGGLSTQFVELVAPAVDWLVVWEDGNQDGWFNKVASGKKIPLTVLKQPLETGKTIAQAFAAKGS